MKVLVFGGKGSLGLELTKLLKPVDYQLVPVELPDIDIRIYEIVQQKLENADFNLVIYAKGYEDVLKAETQQDFAYSINATGALNLALFCKSRNIPLIYISTSYVFDGTREMPYKPDDETNPLNVYGMSKLKGEEAIAQTINNYYIIRTSKMFGVTRPNFIDDIIARSKTGEPLNVISDNKYTPTWTFTLAKGIEKIIETTKLKINFGTYHCTNSGACSDYDIVTNVMNLIKVNTEVNPLKFDEVKHNIPVPKYSVLDCAKLPGIRIHWNDAVRNYLIMKEYIKEEYV